MKPILIKNPERHMVTNADFCRIALRMRQEAVAKEIKVTEAILSPRFDRLLKRAAFALILSTGVGWGTTIWTGGGSSK